MDRPPVHYAHTSDGVAIAYSDFGQGPTLIEIPQGGWTHLALWKVPRIRTFYQRLAERCRIVTYDARGVGLSERGEFAYDDSSHTADLEAVLAAAKAEPTNLLGTHIMGSFAVTYAAQQPERVRRLVLADTWLNGPKYARARPHAGLVPLMSTDPEHFIRLMMQGNANMPVEDVDKHIAAMLPLQHSETLARLFDAQHASDAREAAKRCPVPARVIHHRDARTPGRDFVLEVAQLLPSAEFVEIDGLNHYLEYGPLDETIELISSWLVTRDHAQALPSVGNAAADPKAGRPAHPDHAGPESQELPIENPDRLTARELEVLRLVARGRRSAAIAELLDISPATVARHISNILGKTGLTNRTELARYAADQGLTGEA